MHAHAHFLAEAANALWAKVVVHKTKGADELGPKLALLARLPVTVAPLGDPIGPSAALSVGLNVTVYDSLQLALALRLEVPVVTDDSRLTAAVSRSKNVDGRILWVGDQRLA